NLEVKPHVKVQLPCIAGAARNPEEGRAECAAEVAKVDPVENVGDTDLESHVETCALRITTRPAWATEAAARTAEAAAASTATKTAATTACTAAATTAPPSATATTTVAV